MSRPQPGDRQNTRFARKPPPRLERPYPRVRASESEGGPLASATRESLLVRLKAVALLVIPGKSPLSLEPIGAKPPPHETSSVCVTCDT